MKRYYIEVKTTEEGYTTYDTIAINDNLISFRNTKTGNMANMVDIEKFEDVEDVNAEVYSLKKFMFDGYYKEDGTKHNFNLSEFLDQHILIK